MEILIRDSRDNASADMCIGKSTSLSTTRWIQHRDGEHKFPSTHFHSHLHYRRCRRCKCNKLYLIPSLICGRMKRSRILNCFIAGIQMQDTKPSDFKAYISIVICLRRLKCTLAVYIERFCLLKMNFVCKEDD